MRDCCSKNRDTVLEGGTGAKRVAGAGSSNTRVGGKKSPVVMTRPRGDRRKRDEGKTRTCSRGVGWQGSAQNNRGETEESVANNRDTLVLLVGDESAEMEGLEGTDQGATLCEVPSSLVAEERR